jgi:hypothetical protein
VATNTGVPAGTSLTVVNGDLVVSTSGTVVDARDVHGFIFVRASNVTIKRTVVRGRSASGNGAYINVESGTNVLLEDVEIAPTTPSVWLDGIWADNATVSRAHIHGGVDGMKVGSNTCVKNSYIHDMNYFDNDPNQGDGSTHNDAIQILNGSSITVAGNNLSPKTGSDSGNAAIQVTQDYGAVTGLQVMNNWADYGGCTFNFAHKVGTSMTVSASNNKFGHHSSYSGCAILLSTKTTLNGSGNVYEDTGQAVPIQRHD